MFKRAGIVLIQPLGYHFDVVGIEMDYRRTVLGRYMKVKGDKKYAPWRFIDA